MTDQIPADKVREIIARYRDSAGRRGGMILDALGDLLPAPPRPTLADMTDEERTACRWMQCEVTNSRGKWILATPPDEDGVAGLVSSYGDICWLLPGRVTPRPDLPRMEWPGNKKPVPALPEGWRLADHPKHGRVIVTNSTPNLSGQVYFVLPSDTVYMGYCWHRCDPAELTYLDADQEADTPTGPNTPAVGTVIESADDPRIDALPVGSILLDRDEEAMTKRPGEWTGEGYIPIAYESDVFGPWTVLHIPKEADQ